MSLSRSYLYGCLNKLSLAVAMKSRYPGKRSTCLGMKHSHLLRRIWLLGSGLFFFLLLYNPLYDSEQNTFVS